MILESKKAKAKKMKLKALVAELNEVFLNKTGNELCEKGIYYRLMPVLPSLGGSIDKTTPIVSRMKVIIEELVKVI